MTATSDSGGNWFVYLIVGWFVFDVARSLARGKTTAVRGSKVYARTEDPGLFWFTLFVKPVPLMFAAMAVVEWLGGWHWV